MRETDCSIVKNPDYLLPVRVLSARFRNQLKEAIREHAPELLAKIPAGVWFQRKKWVVHSQAAGSGEPALRYLARYVHKTAISEDRILSDRDGLITFGYRESDSGQEKTATLGSLEFIRRFLQHVLPKGFRRVRTYGWLSPAASRSFGRLCVLMDRPIPKKLAPKKEKIRIPCKICQKPMRMLGIFTRKGVWIAYDTS